MPSKFAYRRIRFLVIVLQIPSNLFYIILVLLSFPFFLITSAFADCYGCNFDNKNLAYFVFADQDLSNASFQGAYLVNADFSRANLQGATFDGAYANGTIFIGAQLDNVSFRSTGYIMPYCMSILHGVPNPVLNVVLWHVDVLHVA